MINKKKLCLVLTATVLSVYNIAYSQEEISQPDNTTANVQEASSQQETIKGNKETFEKAQNAMAQKDFQSAIVYLSAYISSKPKKYEAYKLRGECFYALHQFKLAEMDFQTAVDLKTEDDKFVTGTKYISAVVLGADKQEQLQNTELGNLYAELMYAQKALNKPAYEATYDKAVEYNSHIYLPRPKKDDITRINCPQKYGRKLNEQGVDAEISQIIDNLAKGNFNEALYKTPNIISNYPKYYFGYYLAGVAYSGMENYEDAIEMFQSALKYNPYDFESYASIGEAYYNIAEKTFSEDATKKSVEYFQKALRYNPNCNTYYFYIGLNDLLLNNYDGAISNFNSAIKNKSNDYNSQYYKLIAQQLKGDYKSVEEGASKLLYRHVSNYNSVLYLRALAKYKQGLNQEALSDLENIHNSMNDIYNADIKTHTQKDEILKTYVYYLKSQILQDGGYGVKADIQNAYSNRILADILSSKSEITLSSEDMDNQYDFLRTTFSDKNLKLTYLNPDYKLTLAQSPIIEKSAEEAKPTEKEAVPNFVAEEQMSIPEFTQTANQEQPLKQSTSQSKMIATDDKPSLAQLLASPSFLAAHTKSSDVTIEEVVKTVPQEKQEPPVTIAELPQTPTVVEEIVTEKVQTEAEKIIETEPIKEPATVVIEAVEKQATPDFEIKYETPKIETPKVIESKEIVEKVEEVTETIEKEIVPEKVIIKAENILEEAESGNKPFKITYEQPKVQRLKPIIEGETPKVETPEIPEIIKSEKPTITTTSPIVEKYADVDLTKFDMPKQKPVILEDDEVIVFEPKKNIFGVPVVETPAKPVVEVQNPLPAEIELKQPQNEALEQIAKLPEVLQTTEQAAEQTIEQAAEQVVEQIPEPVIIVPELKNLPEIAKIKPIKETIPETIELGAETVEQISQNIEKTLTPEIETVSEPEPDSVLEEKPIKIKKQRFKKEKIKKEKISKIKQVEEKVEEPIVDEKPTKIGSIVQSILNADDFVITEDENLKKLEEVKPLEIASPIDVEDIVSTEAEKVQKHEKKLLSIFKKSKKQPQISEVIEVKEIEEVIDNTAEEVIQEVETIIPTEEVVISEPIKKVWYKKLFKFKKAASKNSQVEEIPTAVEEPYLEETLKEELKEEALQQTVQEIISIPGFRTEKEEVEIEIQTEPVEEIIPEPVVEKTQKKKFNWLRKLNKDKNNE